MKLEAAQLRLSATDLANHLACRHLTTLERGNAEGRWTPPDYYRPEADVLAQRGLEHEHAYLAHLEREGKSITRLDDEGGGRGIERTLKAMYAGAEVIAQATLAGGRWLGRADVLLKVDRPSPLGAWSYEALDTKLARETKAGAILQLCLYSELLREMQGVPPMHMYVVPRKPDFPLEAYRVDDHLAYYRFVRRRLEAAADAEPAPATYPDPVPHCDICRWWPRCDRQRRGDDHLSFVAGISRLQARELGEHDIATLAALAGQPLPIPWKPARGAREGYARIREQARVQLTARTEKHPVREMLPTEQGRGLARLPAPSPGDLFLDLEADPYVDDGGIEYLFGWAAVDLPAHGAPVPGGDATRYHRRWALSRAAERRGFEELMDIIMARWARDPRMHVYHYGVYEPGAIKRLMGRHATRGPELDRLLRAGRFVDLHAVARQSLRASVEEYSIKALEPFYEFERRQPLDQAGSALRVIQRGLELGATLTEHSDEARTVEAYNRDDCLSALALRDWLERLREELIAGGAEIARPPDQPGEPSAEVGERERRAAELAARLLAGVPEDREQRNDEQQATWLLAHVLDWHRREDKAAWWEYFRLREMSDDELLDELPALAGLEHLERLPEARIDRYRFAPQETSIRARDELHLPLPDGRRLGDVVAIDAGRRTIDIRKTKACSDLHPGSVFRHKVINTDVIASSLIRLGDWVAAHGLDAPGAQRAARDLLLRRAPRLAGHEGGALERPEEGGVRAARRIALLLDHGTLAIQGPPGSGKTFTGARMICDLVRAGKRVGVCAMSHKVIRNLLDEVVRAAPENGMTVRCIEKVEEVSPNGHPAITETAENAEVRAALQGGTHRVAGGTQYMWSREEFLEAVDVLFVDEAGQMSLANVLAIAQSAASLALLGDPRQLDQPIQGSHPDGVAVSALQHVLGDEPTIASDRGLFLEETWRLPPAICNLTSELFYQRRLTAHPGLERQVLTGAGPFPGAGLWYVPVVHHANQSSSPEEVAVVKGLVSTLTTSGRGWRDRNGCEHPLGLADILVIAPYNAQVADLAAALPEGARVGTVDKFQGQEAPVVIYSMTTSTPEDAPRGMEFLYSPNRFNVATSRARCACILVGSPRLFEPDCQSPRQIMLANAFCRFLECAGEVRVDRPAQAGPSLEGKGDR